MSCKRFAINFLSMCLLSLLAHSQQKSMPPPRQDKPLSHRVATMERSERAGWQKPGQVVKALDLKNGEVVADIGAGTGYFTRRFARAVAPDGKVYAVDIAADVLGYLKQRDPKMICTILRPSFRAKMIQCCPPAPSIWHSFVMSLITSPTVRRSIASSPMD